MVDSFSDLKVDTRMTWDENTKAYYSKKDKQQTFADVNDWESIPCAECGKIHRHGGDCD